MPDRVEFSRKVRRAIILRATNAAGDKVCEGRGMVLRGKRHAIDHTLPEGLRIDKSRKLTAADGRLLGEDCCHKPKTAEDIRRIRKADAQGDAKRGAFKPTHRPIPGSRASGWKHKMDGTWQRRDGAR